MGQDSADPQHGDRNTYQQQLGCTSFVSRSVSRSLSLYRKPRQWGSVGYSGSAARLFLSRAYIRY